MPEDKQEKLVDVGEREGADIELESKEEAIEIEAPAASSEKQDSKEAKEPKEVKESVKEEASDKKQEVKKDELEDYSKDVQRRIAKLTKKWRDAEREREEALRYIDVIKGEKESVLKKYSALEGASVKEREARISSGLLAAKAKLAEARNAQDLNAEVEAQKEIARLGYEEARLSEAKIAAESMPKTESKPNINLSRSTEQNFRPDPKAEEWAARNTWFGNDTAMTYTAFDIHKKIMDDGYDPQTDEYYAEIDRRMRLDFPHKFDKNETTESTKPVQQVASAKRSTKPGRKTVRLTPSQVAIAKRLGVPLEEYAKQLTAKEV